MTDAKQCSKIRWSASFYGRRCTKPGKVQHDGKWFCGVHDPERLIAQRLKRNNARSAEAQLRHKNREAAKAKQAELERRAECFPELLEALRAARKALAYAHDNMPWRPTPENNAHRELLATASKNARAAIKKAGA